MVSFDGSPEQGPAFQSSKACASLRNRTADDAAEAWRAPVSHRWRQHKQLSFQSFPWARAMLTIAAMPTLSPFADPSFTAAATARMLRVTAVAWNIAPLAVSAPARRAPLAALPQGVPRAARRACLALALPW
jgi:hypothetical protein